MQKNNFDNNLTTNGQNVLNTVSIVDSDEVVKRNNNEYIYLDAVGGVVVQPDEVNTIKNRQSIDVLKNQLLGHFNAETGKYEISNNIELELQQIVKVEGNHIGNAVYCDSLSSFGGLGVLKFVVKTSVKRCKATSQLFIFERVKKMAKMVTNTQIQLVSEFERTNDNYSNFDSLTFENYYRFAWEHFKIVRLSQMFALSEDEKFLQGWIVRRKLYLGAMDEKLDSAIELAESDLLLTRIEVLSGLGDYGYKVLARFEELKNQASKYIGGEFKARDQNEILEEAIETFRGRYPIEQEKFFTKQYKSVETYTKKISSLKDKNHKQVLTEIEERMPTVVEVIKQEDERRKLEAQAAKDVKKAQESAQTTWPKDEQPKAKKEVEKPAVDAKAEQKVEPKNSQKPQEKDLQSQPVEPKAEQKPQVEQPKVVEEPKVEQPNIPQPTVIIKVEQPAPTQSQPAPQVVVDTPVEQKIDIPPIILPTVETPIKQSAPKAEKQQKTKTQVEATSANETITYEEYEISRIDVEPKANIKLETSTTQRNSAVQEKPREKELNIAGEILGSNPENVKRKIGGDVKRAQNIYNNTNNEIRVNEINALFDEQIEMTSGKNEISDTLFRNEDVNFRRTIH